VSPVAITRRGTIAVVTVDNPPVNAASHAVRAALLDAFTQLAADAEVKGAVLACAGRTFIAGSDIREFGKPVAEPHLSVVIDFIESMPKPVVAAIHGTALGGGFELTMGCHYRVATADAKVGLPEVNLGLIPGGTGTQRLPRLIGAEEALKAIHSGNHMPAADAKKRGAIDEVAKGDVVDAAVAAAERLAASGNLRRTSTLMASAPPPGYFEQQRIYASARHYGYDAIPAAIEAVEASLLPYADGLKIERKLSDELKMSHQSAAQRYLFFGEREVSRAAKEAAAAPSTDILGRTYNAYAGAIQFLVREGVAPPHIDRALKKFGMEESPCAAAGLIGGDESTAMADDEIVARCIYPIINAGADVVEEGLTRPVNIDVAWCARYGFPRWRGGPLFHADHIGLQNIVGKVENPSPLLVRLAAEGKGFQNL